MRLPGRVHSLGANCNKCTFKVSAVSPPFSSFLWQEWDSCQGPHIQASKTKRVAV